MPITVYPVSDLSFLLVFRTGSLHLEDTICSLRQGLSLCCYFVLPVPADYFEPLLIVQTLFNLKYNHLTIDF